MTHFLNVQEMINRDYLLTFSEDKSKMMNLSFSMGDKHYIHNRRVYGLMDFLGDAGGIYGSMIIFG